MNFAFNITQRFFIQQNSFYKKADAEGQRKEVEEKIGNGVRDQSIVTPMFVTIIQEIIAETFHHKCHFHPCHLMFKTPPGKSPYRHFSIDLIHFADRLVLLENSFEEN